MGARFGLDAKLYRNDGSYESPTWTEMKNVRDVTLNVEKGERGLRVAHGDAGVVGNQPGHDLTTFHPLPFEYEHLFDDAVGQCRYTDRKRIGLDPARRLDHNLPGRLGFEIRHHQDWHDAHERGRPERVAGGESNQRRRGEDNDPGQQDSRLPSHAWRQYTSRHARSGDVAVPGEQGQINFGHS